MIITLASKANFRYIDLESSSFFVNGERPNDWVKIYVNIAEHLETQGCIVFVSTHKEVRDELESRNIKFCNIYPSLDLKEEWISKIETRYKMEPTEKNKKALSAVESYYDKMVTGMSDGIGDCIVIDDINYDLNNLITNYVGRN